MFTEIADESIPIQKKNKGGHPLNGIWEDINKGTSVGSGKFTASCKYCDMQWKRSDIPKLEEHLSNHCQSAPAAVVRKYMTKVIERQDKPSKKRKLERSSRVWTIITTSQNFAKTELHELIEHWLNFLLLVEFPFELLSTFFS